VSQASSQPNTAATPVSKPPEPTPADPAAPVSPPPHSPDAAVDAERQAAAQAAQHAQHSRFEAMNSLEALLKHIAHSCSEKERLSLIQDIQEVHQMRAKLEQGRIDIVIFGEIDTGKSALVNALTGHEHAGVSVRGGWTRDVFKFGWEGFHVTIPGLEHVSIQLIDTPGINEVQGQDRADMARKAAQYADLILFVTDSDLNEVEAIALQQLADTSRPIIVVFNKIDQYTKTQRDEIRDVLLERRLPESVSPENLVEAAADPRALLYVIESPDGSEREEERKPPVQVNALRQRIRDVLQQDGAHLLALNASMAAADISDKIATFKIRTRTRQADALIRKFMISKALVVAINPLPAADILGGVGVDVAMVIALGKLYGIDMSRENATTLIREIAASAGLTTAAQLVTGAGFSFLKAMSFGTSTLLTGPLQGAAAAYGSYIVGLASRHYYEHGASWAGNSPKNVVQSILQYTDKQSVLAGVRDEVRYRLQRNRHATDADTPESPGLVSTLRAGLRYGLTLNPFNNHRDPPTR